MMIDVTPSGFDVRHLGGRSPITFIEVKDVGGTVSLLIEDVEAADDLIAAALEVRALLARTATAVA